MPKWGLDSIKFAASNNPKRPIILLIDNNSKNLLRIRQDFLLIVLLDDNFIELCNMRGAVNLTNVFWINTAKRLKIIYLYCKNAKIKSFFHAEIDNLVFDLNDLEVEFNKSGRGFFAPKDSATRVIASLIFCNRIQTFDEIFKYFYHPYSVSSEMEALGLFSKNSKFFFGLPTESFYEINKKWEIIDPSQLNGIFDAAAIGQYLLGIDPIHQSYKPLFNMFWNENALVDFNDLIFSCKNKSFFIFFKKIRKNYKVYNLHIHSKKIKLAIDMIEGKNLILKNLLQGKKTLIAKRNLLITGKLKLFLNFLKRISINFIALFSEKFYK